MGLMDVLNGMQNGPRGARGAAPTSSAGMSPITMAVLGLLGYKALKHLMGGPSARPAAAAPGQTLPPTPARQSADSGAAASGATDSNGGIGGLLKGGLGGLLAGGAAGSVLSGGLNDLLKQFQQAGQGGTVNSWIGNGPNKSISPDDLNKVLDSDQVKTLTAQTGLSRDELLKTLSQYLPGMVDELTPNGRLPSEQEVSRLMQ